MNAGLAILFRRHGSAARFAPGAALFTEGDPCRHVILFEEGSVRLFRPRPGDREGTLYRVRAGELCLASCLGALREEPLFASAEVDGPAAGWAVPAPTFRRLFDQDEYLRRMFLDTLSGRLRALFELFADIQDLSVDDRLASYLLDRARVGPRMAGEGRLMTTHEKIAADLWTAREVVSRALKGLEQRGCVRLERGSVVVLNPERLAAQAAERPPRASP